MIWYLGDGQEDTGNWCFKDGSFISFYDILKIYKTHFRGRVLTIVTDCPFSGNWCGACTEELDSLAIPACGHKAMERGILVRVYASCRGDEIARDMWFSTCTAVYNDGHLWLFRTEDERQHTQIFDFTKASCSEVNVKDCPATTDWKWKNKKFKSGDNRIILVRGKDRGHPAWHYVRVHDPLYDECFLQISQGSIDVADFGKVLRSGWGKDPPPETVKWIKDEYVDISN